MARFAFFGTPEFAVPSLKALHHMALRQGHEICFVVSQPDRKRDREQKMSAPPVKQCAQALGFLVHQPETLKKGTVSGDTFFEIFQAAQIDLAVVVAYGRMIPKRLLALPPCGFVNVHGSLLPRWRGAAPIQRALEAGDQYAGVCIMDMVWELDAGDVYESASVPICPIDTSDSLAKRLSHEGGNLLASVLPDILNKTAQRVPQRLSQVTFAPLLEKEEGLLDFKKPARALVNQARAMHPWPGSYVFVNNKRLRLFCGFALPALCASWQKMPLGQIVSTTPFLGIRVLDGAVYFAYAQLEGRKCMSMRELVLGFPIRVGDQCRGHE